MRRVVEARAWFAVALLHVMAGAGFAQTLSSGADTVRTLDRTPEGTPLFAGPVGVRCHPDGRVLVVDDLAHVLLVFTADGHPAGTFGGYGPDPGRLLWPDAVHWDARGNLYLADTGANRIQVWDQTGRYLRDFGRPPRWRRAAGPALGLAAIALTLLAAIAALGGGRLFGAGRLPVTVVALAGAGALATGWGLLTFVLFDGLRNPRDVLIGRDGLVYVSDFGGHAVRVFTEAGALDRSIGHTGRGPGELRNPLGLALSDDRLFVADAGNHRIQVFSLDGRFIRSLGQRGTGPGELDSPHGLALGPDGLLYIADRGNARVQVWTTEGRVVGTIRPDPEPGRRDAFAPAGLCVTGDGVLVVADLESHRIVMTPAP